MFSLKSLFKSNTQYNSLPKELVQEYNRNRPLGPKKKLCYAPYKSMYFGHGGKYAVCCYNREHSLGTYPEQSIKQAWFGEQADKLRDHISNNDLSLGCTGCKEHLTSGNFDGIKATECDNHTLNGNKYPSVMEFELSNVCNLECEMCSGTFSSLIRAKREKLPPIKIPYDTAFIDQLEEFIPYLDEVKFYGGEPFLIDLYYEIWERIKKIKPSVVITVQTNGTVLNNKVKELLAKTNFHIGISLDSMQKETYESIRVNANFERVTENVKWFREYCRERKSFFGISVCAMKNNWQELPDFINYCNEIEAPIYFHTVLWPANLSLRTMTLEELEDVYEYLMKFEFANDTPLQKKNRKHYFDFANRINAWIQDLIALDQQATIRNLNDLKTFVTKQIQRDRSLTKEAQKKKIDNIIGKISECEGQAQEAAIEKAFQNIDLSDRHLLDNVINSIENSSITELLGALEQQSTIRSFSGLKAFVTAQIYRDDTLTKEARQEKIDRIIGKMDACKGQVEEAAIEAAFSQIDLSDKDLLASVIKTIENSSVTELVARVGKNV